MNTCSNSTGTTVPAITRRAAMFGAALSTAALAVPAVAAVTTAEHPWVKARRLAKELAATLAEIETADTASGSVVAVIYPAGHAHSSGFWDIDYYLEGFDRQITEAQAEAIAAWQLITIETRAQWDVYCKSGKGREPRRVDDMEYVKWQALYQRQQDAHIEMTRVFYPAVRS